MNSPPETFAIGKVIRPQGLSGEVKIQPWTDEPAQWLDFSHCLRKTKGGFLSCPLIHARVQGGYVYAKLEGVDTREGAEALRGEELFIQRSSLQPLGEGAWYVADLIGCRALEDGGREMGVLTDVLSRPANDVYVIRTSKGELLVPALLDVLECVDIPGRKVVFRGTRLREVSEYED